MDSGKGSRTLVLDFDGTITARDTLDLVVHEFGDPDVRRRTEAELGETLTLHEVIGSQYGSVSASVREVLEWLPRHVRVRPGLRELVQAVREQGWEVVVVSSGVRELIEPLLDGVGLGDVKLVCNSLHGQPPPWNVRFHDSAPCEVCGQACKRRTVDALANRGEVVYVGDGYSDACAAEIADRVFARRRLATYLEQHQRAFQGFEDFFDVLRGLKLDSA